MPHNAVLEVFQPDKVENSSIGTPDGASLGRIEVVGSAWIWSVDKLKAVVGATSSSIRA